MKKILLVIVLFSLGNADSIFVDKRITGYVTDYSRTARDRTGTCKASGTVRAAIANMTNGDDIFMRGGIYRERTITIPLTKNGSSVKWNTLQSYPGEWAILDGEDLLDNDSCYLLGYPGMNNRDEELHYWVFQRFEMRRASSTLNGSTRALWVNGGPFIVRHVYFNKNWVNTNGDNPSAIRMYRPHDSKIQYCYFQQNGAYGFDRMNGAQIALFSDYNWDRDIDSLVDSSNCTRRNDISFNLFDSSSNGIKHKATQVLTTGHNGADMRYKSLGDNFHHNVFRGHLNAICGNSDFLQIHHNISYSGSIEISEQSGTEPDRLNCTVYNNTVILGKMFIPEAHDAPQATYAPFVYVVNNLIDSGVPSWDLGILGFGDARSAYTQNYDATNLIANNNYLYRPTSMNHFSFGSNTGNNCMMFRTVAEVASCYSFTNWTNSSSGVFQGTSGITRYKTNNSNVIDGAITIADGGVGGNHPYLTGITFPGYVGANGDGSLWSDTLLVQLKQWMEGGEADSFSRDDPPMGMDVDTSSEMTLCDSLILAYDSIYISLFSTHGNFTDTAFACTTVIPSLSLYQLLMSDTWYYWKRQTKSAFDSLWSAIDSFQTRLDTSSHMIFTTIGDTFSPVIILKDGMSASVQWRYADGTNSTDLAPTKIYGSAATRRDTLYCTNWAAIKRLNLGYDAGDGGTDSIELVRNNYITEIIGLELVAQTLVHLCVSNNPLTALDVDGFTSLVKLEAFYCRYLTTFSKDSTFALKRLCLENNDIVDTLDLSCDTALEDLRATDNRLTHILYPDSLPHLWHFCVNSNPMQENYRTDLMTHVQQLWIANANQIGAFELASDNLVSLWLFDNAYTSIDISQSDVPVVLHLDAHNNNVSTSAIATLLNFIDTVVWYGDLIDLSENNPPNAAALASAASLTGKGWTVNLDEGEPAVLLPSIAASTEFARCSTAYAMIAVTITNTGGPATVYHITPAPPAGLAFDTLTGTTSGTPTDLADSAEYRVVGSNTTGSDTCFYSLQVFVGRPDFRYARQSIVIDTGDMARDSAISTRGAIASWAADTLPPGILLATTGALYGNPADTGHWTCTITATNTSGSQQIIIPITVRFRNKNSGNFDFRFHTGPANRRY